jgi:hypothetical protein
MGLYQRDSIETFTGYASGVRTWTETRNAGSVSASTTSMMIGGTATASTTVIDTRRTFTTVHTGFFLEDETGATRDVDAANVGPSIAEGHLASAAWLVHNQKSGNAFLVYNHTTGSVYVDTTKSGGMTARRGLVSTALKLPLAYQVLGFLLIATIPLMLLFGLGAQWQVRRFRKRGARPLMAVLERRAAEMPSRRPAAAGICASRPDTCRRRGRPRLADKGTYGASPVGVADG